MKTAVSIPDDLFRSADKLARRRRLSRSRLYSEALRDYLSRDKEQNLIARTNAALAQANEPPDPAMRRATRATFRRNSW